MTIIYLGIIEENWITEFKIDFWLIVIFPWLLGIILIFLNDSIEKQLKSTL